MLFLASSGLRASAQTGVASGEPPGGTPRFVLIKASEGGDVTADEYGSGGRAVILAHGGRFDRASWKKQAEVLAARGFRVLAIDFRAAVASRKGEETSCLYDVSCLAKDVLAAVRYLRLDGAKQVSIVGGSLGGGAAAQASIEAKTGEIDRIVLLAHMLIDEPQRMMGRKLEGAGHGQFIFETDQGPRLLDEILRFLEKP